MEIRKLKPQKNIALVAHDHKKSELIEWSANNKAILSGHNLFATGTTGSMIEKATSLPISKFLSGPLGGDLEVGAHIAEGKIDVLIFFWDPMEAQPHDPDVKALLRVAVTYNIPIACNLATADFLLTSPFMQENYEAALSDYSSYRNRKI